MLGDAVHVWLTDPLEVDAPPLVSAYQKLLTPEERQRFERFRFPEHRHEFLVTRALVRTTLTRYAPVAPEAWRFGFNAHGRPHIVPPVQPPLHFNLSNTHGLVACVVGSHADIGIDVEDTLRHGQTVEIAERFFAPLEVAELRSRPPEAQRSRFFDYWTLKEAYIKARGMGLAIPLAQFWFSSLRATIRIGFGPELQDDPETWQFQQSSPTPSHRLAVAVRRGANRPEVNIVTRWTRPLLD